MKRKRLFTLILTTLLCAAQLISCGGQTAEVPDNSAPTVTTGEQNTDVPTNETSAETEAPDLSDDLPETDLEGYSFRILGFNDARFASVWVEETNGSPVNDAVYSKLATVQERFNCEIVLANGGLSATNTEQTTIRSLAQAGDDVYDVATGHDISMANIMLEGMFVNLYDVDHLNFEKPWWPKHTVDSLTFDGQMYLFSNHISYNNIGETRLLYFNKELLTDNGIEHPYTSVYDGSWTLDKLISITEDGYLDTNGDSVQGDDDTYGIVNPKYYYCFLEPFRHENYVKEGSKLVYNFDIDKSQTLVEKFYTLLTGAGGRITDNAETIFKEKRSMFFYHKVSTAANVLSLTDLVYGILPMPKLDEAQEEYFSGCTERPFAVPILAEVHLDTTGLIIEALSAEGYRQVFPVYFEQALKSRYADKNDDANMIDIINSNVIISFTYMHGNFASPYNNMLETLFNAATPGTDVSSYAASIRSTQEERCETITEIYKNLKNQ